MSLTNIDYRLGKNHTLGVQFYFEEEVDDKARREYGIRYQYKINKNWKTKLSYKLAYGYRRDEDWIKDGAGNWIWLDANNRVEHQTRWLFSYQNRIKSKTGSAIFMSLISGEDIVHLKITQILFFIQRSENELNGKISNGYHLQLVLLPRS